ncbi:MULTISPECIES: DUF4352 domain-containing protein [Clostridium]|uniref:DUF4352 domain-containing protein n=2 Tax=Clostridium cadaveris TaxID=1529 RepID=A0A316M4J0_9CLOT|nr:DUF4352 domain-containing protein [Clostridium cadaveris]MDU4952840.1 DUF4352 domain-containing protein [Clostridium sp.]MDM8313108.1 DUF4352 domain-containing protein [Clostridium cadaveris]NME66247.1 DUF4352 domain-containing protein [Clostridium cadaveris]NWK11353.1 DUF4352 domain-containing protein [Clostridium cadaveris]PWL53276.1 MAG: DUF4352 domain-containing protein [Clostridium cadaveris]
MKRIVRILLVGLMMSTLVACGNANIPVNEEGIKQEKKEDNYIAYGDSADSGNWNIKIRDVSEVSEVDKKDGGKFTADGKFINTLLDMKNISQNPVSYSLTDFKLKDISTGKTYVIEDIGYEVAHELISEEKFYKGNDEYITIMDDVNPDKSKIACISFEVNEYLQLDNLVLVNKNNGNAGEGVQFKLK